MRLAHIPSLPRLHQGPLRRTIARSRTASSAFFLVVAGFFSLADAVFLPGRRVWHGILIDQLPFLSESDGIAPSHLRSSGWFVEL